MEIGDLETDTRSYSYIFVKASATNSSERILALVQDEKAQSSYILVHKGIWIVKPYAYE